MKKLNILGTSILFIAAILLSSFIGNGDEREIWYTCVKLDSASTKTVLDYARANNPWPTDSFYYSCDHMTIYHKADGNHKNKEWSKQHEGTAVKLRATKVGHSDKAFALYMESDVPVVSGVPHVTLAVNITNGGKAYQSKDITNWQVLDSTIVLEGKIHINYADANTVDK